MFARVEPSQDGDHCSPISRDASRSRAAAGDVEEERRAGARVDRPTVVVDYHRVVVDGTGLAEIFPRRFVERALTRGARLVGVVGG
jgi:hypothetical protein